MGGKDEATRYCPRMERFSPASWEKKHFLHLAAPQPELHKESMMGALFFPIRGLRTFARGARKFTPWSLLRVLRIAQDGLQWTQPGANDNSVLLLV
jgi:hypothetical protein